MAKATFKWKQTRNNLKMKSMSKIDIKKIQQNANAMAKPVEVDE